MRGHELLNARYFDRQILGVPLWKADVENRKELTRRLAHCSHMDMRGFAIPLLLLLLAAGQAQGARQVHWSADLLIGDAYNFDSRTHIEQEELGGLSLNGDYETQGLEEPLHYAWRVSRWQEDRAWELQFLHHKLYLENRPPGIEALSVSHGFNIVTLNRALERNAWKVRIGVGPVIAHPEARISGASYDGPYEIAGAAALVGAGRSFTLSHRWSLNAEASLTFGYIDVRPTGPPDLEFSIRNPAIHAQIGLGYRF